MPRLNTALNFVIPTGADPDFLHRGTAQGYVCGFLRKPHEVRRCHQAGRKSGVAQGRDLQLHSDRTQMPTSASEIIFQTPNRNHSESNLYRRHTICPGYPYVKSAINGVRSLRFTKERQPEPKMRN